MALGQKNLAVAAAAALDPAFLANAIVQQQRENGQFRQESPVSNTSNGGHLGVAALLREQEGMPRDSRNSHSAFDAFHSVPPAQLSPNYMKQNRTAEGSAVAAADPRYNAYIAPTREQMSNGYDSLSVSASVSPGISSNASYYRNAAQLSGPYSRMQHDSLNDDLSSRRSVIGQTADGYTQHSFYGKGEDAFASRNGYYPASQSNLGSRFHGLSLNTGLGSGMRPSSPPGGMTSPRGSNPADQNPPINTLYVGGLPAVSRIGLFSKKSD